MMIDSIIVPSKTAATGNVSRFMFITKYFHSDSPMSLNVSYTINENMTAAPSTNAIFLFVTGMRCIRGSINNTSTDIWKKAAMMISET